MRNLNKFNQENFVGEGLSPVFSKIIFPQTAMQNRLWEYYFLFTTSWCARRRNARTLRSPTVNGFFNR